MTTGVVIAVAACAAAIGASWFMWWTTGRSAVWSMAAGIILGFLAIGGALIIAWLLTRAAFGR